MHNSEGSRGFANVEGEMSDGEKVSPDAMVFSRSESGDDVEEADYENQQEIRDVGGEHADEQKAEREEKSHKLLKKLGAIAAMLALSGGLVIAGKNDLDTLEAEQRAEENMDFYDTYGHFIISGNSGRLEVGGRTYFVDHEPDAEVSWEQIHNELIQEMDEANTQDLEAYEQTPSDHPTPLPPDETPSNPES